MTPDQRFTLIMFGLGVLVSLLAWVLRILPKVSQQWIRTGIKLEDLSEKISEVIRAESEAHVSLHKRIDRHEDTHERR